MVSNNWKSKRKGNKSLRNGLSVWEGACVYNYKLIKHEKQYGHIIVLRKRKPKRALNCLKRLKRQNTSSFSIFFCVGCAFISPSLFWWRWNSNPLPRSIALIASPHRSSRPRGFPIKASLCSALPLLKSEQEREKMMWESGWDGVLGWLMMLMSIPLMHVIK